MQTKPPVTQAARPVLRARVSALVLCGLVYGSPDTLAATATAAANWNLPPTLQIQRSGQLLIEVDPDRVARRSVPATVFGFNTMWMNFQRGYWRDNQVRPEVIEWLKPFSGAVYRYPGGGTANWFEWQKAVGPAASRAEQYTDFGPTKAEFGFDEFLNFVKAVHGVPLVTVNLKGTRGTDKTVWDDDAAMRSNAEWVEYSVQREGGAATSSVAYCQEGKKCPVRWWELGNELDWGKGAWTSERYVNRARVVGRAMKEVDPAIKLLAHTTSSPWGQRSIEWEKAVGSGLSGIVDGYVYHPYYDGISVPEVNRYMERAVNGLSAPSANGVPPSLFITEHARWPNKPKMGKWDTVWAKTGNLGGALSTADYLLSQMAIPNVRAAMWHSLGARGPWQLFYLDSGTDELYPNVVYWGLRVLREGLLDDAVRVRVSSPNTSGYRGGYDVRAVFMRDRTGARHSLMTVNRSGSAQKARLTIPKWAGRLVNARQYFITGGSQNDANVKEEKSRVVMHTRSMALQFDAQGMTNVNLPALSVSTVIIEQ